MPRNQPPRFMLHLNGDVDTNLYVLGMRNERFEPITIFHKDTGQLTPNAEIYMVRGKL